MLSAEEQQKAIGALLQRKENSLCAECAGKSPCCTFAAIQGPLWTLGSSSA